MVGEPRVISAKRTAFYKFVMPLLTVGVAIGLMTVALRSSTSSTLLYAKIIVAGLIAAYFLGARRYADLKFVSLIDDTLPSPTSTARSSSPCATSSASRR